jgi:SRSO17 transposase
MNLPREAITTISFIDQYCAAYQDLFPEVRSFECFKFLHLGMISELKRKSLPASAKAVGLDNAQPLHHFLANSPWEVNTIRQRRIWLGASQCKQKYQDAIASQLKFRQE